MSTWTCLADELSLEGEALLFAADEREPALVQRSQAAGYRVVEVDTAGVTDFRVAQARIAAVLRTVGRRIRDASPVRITSGSPYIHYSLWRDGAALKIYALDADWRSEERPGSALTVRTAGRARRIPVRPGRLVAATVR